jgi:competence protein ComEC
VKFSPSFFHFLSTAALFGIGLLFYFVFSFSDRAPLLTVSFLDVGQGDAIFIQSPTGTQVLIDAGAGGAVLRELAKVMPYGDRSIDLIIATHPDMDHIGGFPDVFERYDIATVVHSGVSHTTSPYRAFMSALDEEGAEAYVAKRGMRFHLGDGAYLDVLFPDRDLPDVDPNDASVITQVVYGNTSFMLTGDAPSGIERWLVALDGKYLQSAVLKAGHHGSKTSTHPEFLQHVLPEMVVISAGKDNRYGHPHEEVVAHIKEVTEHIVRTAEAGAIHFVSDGRVVKRK